MGIAIRQASLESEEEKLIEILDRNLPDRPNRKIHKKRHANPLGPGWSWVAYLQGTETIIATASAFPRWFLVNGKRVLCAQVVDFAVEAPYRSLGPAVLLQKATFMPAVCGEVAFCYDCPPHDRGMSTFVRLGMPPTCEVHRYAFLLRSDEYLAKRLGTGTWTKPLVATANAMLQMRRIHHSECGLEIRLENGAFGEEFSFLDEATSSSGAVRASRAAEELNWRYLGDPSEANGSSTAKIGEYRIIVARRAGELVGYAIISVQSNGVAWIADFFGRNILDFGPPLLHAILEICRQEKVTRLDAFCCQDCAFSSLLENTGFRSRQRIFSVVPYEDPNRSCRVLPHDLCWPFGSFEVSA